MPAYRVAASVGEAFSSVLAQSESDFELIMWDDGSPDDTAAAAEAAIGGDPRGRVVRAAHQTLTPSLRDAFAAARGRFVAQVDADDRLHPHALRDTLGRLRRRPKAGFVYTRHREIDTAGRPPGPGRRDRVPFDRNRMLLVFMTFHFRSVPQDRVRRGRRLGRELPPGRRLRPVPASGQARPGLARTTRALRLPHAPGRHRPAELRRAATLRPAGRQRRPAAEGPGHRFRVTIGFGGRFKLVRALSD